MGIPAAEKKKFPTQKQLLVVITEKQALPFTSDNWSCLSSDIPVQFPLEAKDPASRIYCKQTTIVSRLSNHVHFTYEAILGWCFILFLFIDGTSD